MRNRPTFVPAAIAAALVVSLPARIVAAEPPGSAQRPTAVVQSVIDSELADAIAKGPKASQWPDDNYARLLDIGNVTVRSDGTIVATYRETYRLFNERAREKAEVALPYNSSYQTVRLVRARTIGKNGKVTEVKPVDVRVSSPYSDFLMYDDAMSLGFSMPAVEDDCIIDYTFEMVSRPLLMPGQFWTYWGFSGPEPVYLCRYTLKSPADKPLVFKTYNDTALKPAVTTSSDGRTKTYVWEKRDIEPTKLEPSMPPYSELHSWMEVSSLGAWNDIAKWYWSLAKPQMVATAPIKATVQTLIAGKSTDDEKARAIYDWVANRTRYVGLEFGISAFKPHAADNVHSKLYGDCKDKATLLITMLGEAGIKAHPVLLHAEDRSPVADRLPSPNAFDHCIALAEVGGKEVWLDATAETTAYGNIPDGDRGVQALVVNDGAAEFKVIPRYQASENGIDVSTAITLRADGSADVHTGMNWRGAAGQAWRASVRSITPDKRKQLMQQLAQAFSVGANIKEFNLPDGIDKTGPCVMSLTSAAPNLAKKTGSLLLVPVSSWSGAANRRNPYVQEKRYWPIVEEETSLTTETTTITLPDGYVVEDLPENVSLSGPLQNFNRTITRVPEKNAIKIEDTVTERPGRVPATEYAKVRAYYDSVLKAGEDQIVLKRAK